MNFFFILTYYLDKDKIVQIYIISLSTMEQTLKFTQIALKMTTFILFLLLLLLLIYQQY
jgi:hypothetical protein